MRNLGIVLLSSLLFACTSGDDSTDDAPQDSGEATVECDDSVCVLSGTITEDLTLTSDYAWLLRGGVFIGDDENETVLTIEPGTTVYGESSTDGMLVIRRHSKLVAEGTATEPIVFTSSKAEGSRARGDWGGIIINGNAPINACTDEDGCQAFGEGGTGWYGGNDATDNSGVLKYVRVEFAGTLVSPDNELNGIAFQGVGSGTTIDYVQVHMNADDGVEFFGGTAEAKHLLITGAGDDSMDWTDGWTGKAQFVILQQYADASDNGIEADNNGENNDATPRSMPTISNVTIVGSPNSSASDVGMLIREGTAAHLSNIVVTAMNDSCLDIDHTSTFNQITSGDLTISNSRFDCVKNFEQNDQDFNDDGTNDTDPTDIAAWFSGVTTNSLGAADLEAPTNETAPNFAPKSTSALLGAGAAPSDSFFDTADFIGAIGTDDWTAGWTTSAAN